MRWTSRFSERKTEWIELKRTRLYFLSHSTPNTASHPPKGNFELHQLNLCPCIVQWKLGHLPVLNDLLPFANITITVIVCCVVNINLVYDLSIQEVVGAATVYENS